MLTDITTTKAGSIMQNIACFEPFCMNGKLWVNCAVYTFHSLQQHYKRQNKTLDLPDSYVAERSNVLSLLCIISSEIVCFGFKSHEQRVCFHVTCVVLLLFLLIAGLFVCLFVFIYLFVNYFLFGIILFINHFNVVPLFRWSRLLIDFTDFIIYLLAYIFILFIYVFIYFNL